MGSACQALEMGRDLNKILPTNVDIFQIFQIFRIYQSIVCLSQQIFEEIMNLRLECHFWAFITMSRSSPLWDVSRHQSYKIKFNYVDWRCLTFSFPHYHHPCWYDHDHEYDRHLFFGLLISMLELSQVNCWPGSMLSYSVVNFAAPSPCGVVIVFCFIITNTIAILPWDRRYGRWDRSLESVDGRACQESGDSYRDEEDNLLMIMVITFWWSWW